MTVLPRLNILALNEQPLDGRSKLPIPPVYIFITLVFVLSWPILIYGFGWFASSAEVLKRYLLSCTGMLMVAFSAFLTRVFVERRGFKDVGLNLGNYKWYLAVLLFFLFLWLGPSLVALLFRKLELNQALRRDEIIVVILSLGGFSLLAGFGEEFGWRGYLIPRLLCDRKMTRLVLLSVGVVWGIWHCAAAIGPFLKAGLEGSVGWLSLVGPTLVRCFQMIASSIALSFIFGAVWLKSKSIFVSSFFHGYWVGIRDSASHLFIYPSGFCLVTLLIVVAAWFIANRWLEKYERRTK